MQNTPQIDISSVIKEPIVEYTLFKRIGKNRKALIVETNFITKEVKFVVLDELEELTFSTIEEAVTIYNRI